MSSSTSSTVKCNSCNIVINEVLAYVQNKIDIVTNVFLVQMCMSGFSEKDIEEAKCLLFESLSAKKITRTGAEKCKRNVNDIISLMRKTEPDVMPIFVAKQLEKLPPVTFDSADVTCVLKEIRATQKELKTIQEQLLNVEQYVTKEDFERLKFELAELKPAPREREPYVNFKRGAYCQQESDDGMSGPMGLLTYEASPDINSNRPTVLATNESEAQFEAERNTHMSSRSPTTHTQKSISLTPPPPVCMAVPATPPPSGIHNYCDEAASSAFAATASAPSTRPSSSPKNNRATTESHRTPPKVHICTKAVENRGSKTQSRISKAEATQNSSTKNEVAVEKAPAPSFAGCAREPGAWKLPQKSDDWILVQRNRYKNRFIGKKGVAITTPECKFRAADIKVPFFINHVNKETSSNDIVDYIRSKTNLTVTMEKLKRKEEKDYDAYKMFVPKHKADLFMADDIWPEGITFRRFIEFRTRQKSNNE